MTSGYGELSDHLEFFVWEDTNGNNQYDNGEKVFVPAGTPFNQIKTEMIALELKANNPLTLVGVEWCAGTQALNGTTVSCDGAGMGNIAQSDSMNADFLAYAVQMRNNEGFSCKDIPVNTFKPWPTQ